MLLQEEGRIPEDRATKMSLTPRVQSHQPPSPPPRSKQQAKAPLLPIERKPTASFSSPTKPTTAPRLAKPTSSSTAFTKPSSSALQPSSSTLLTKPSTSFSRIIHNRTSISSARVSTGTLITISSELSLPNKPEGGGGSLVPTSIPNRETGLVQFERSRSKYDGRGIVLPQDDANISIDKLLAQWEDKINRAEQEFEEEELAFERAQARLSSAPNRASLRSLSPNASTRLLEKAKRIIGSQKQTDKTRLSPIKKHYHHPS